MGNALVWLITQIGMGFYNIAYAVTQPGLWLDWHPRGHGCGARILQLNLAFTRLTPARRAAARRKTARCCAVANGSVAIRESPGDAWCPGRPADPRCSGADQA